MFYSHGATRYVGSSNYTLNRVASVNVWVDVSPPSVSILDCLLSSFSDVCVWLCVSLCLSILS